MKFLKPLLIVVALFVATSTFAPKAEAQSILGTILNGGKSSGESAGAALRDIYDQYKVDGKLDMSNVRTIKNVTVLANSIQGLKGQKISSTFCKDFAKGLVVGSNSLFSTKNSTNVTKSLLGMANNVDFSSLLGGGSEAQTSNNSGVESLLGNLTGGAKAAIPQAKEVSSTIQSIFNMIK